MKKRVMFAVLLTYTLFVLCACGCNHEWTEANCLQPKTCAKCGETEGTVVDHEYAAATCEAPKTCSWCGVTEGEALGHQWIDATCAAPASCDACGVIQGEVLPHDFGDWEITGEEMTRQCTVCESSETVAVDREVYVMDKLLGHWDLYAFYLEDFTVMSSEMKGFGYYAYISDDGEFNLKSLDQSMDFQLEFLEYSSDSEFDTYRVRLTNEEGYIGGLFADYPVLEDLLIIYLSETQMIIFQKQERIADYVAGTWADYEDGQLYILQMNDDRTFTSNYNGEISGIWCVKPMLEEDSGHCYLRLAFCYENNGKTMEFLGEILFHSKEFAEMLLPYECDQSLLVYNSDDRHTFVFNYLGEDGLAVWEDAIAENLGGEIAGEWKSYRVETIDYASGEITDIEDSSYSAVIREDGTFTLMLDEEKTGTWEFEDCYYVSALGYVQYDYVVYFDGESGAHHWIQNEADGLRIWTDDEEKSVGYSFNRTN